MLKRRDFLSSSLAVAGVAVMGTPARARGLDPVNPDILFGTTGSVFGSWPGKSLRMSTNMRMMLEDCRHFGLEGFEPYSGQAAQYLDNVAALKQLSRETGVAIACVGDLPRRPSAAPAPRPANAPPQYPWLGGEGRDKLIAEMEACARDFLQPLGIDHWKNNMGDRPPQGTSDDQLKGLADTANEIGRRTKKYGVRLALHPHVWGPMEREHEFRRVLELTDPNYVHIIMDTGHNVLGGMDPVKMTDEYFSRIVEFHLKDTFPRFRGNKSTPSRESQTPPNKSLYAAVGQGGGVDFPGVFAVMRKKHFKGWAVFDIDAPRKGDGTGTVDDNLAACVNYLRTKLGVKLPPADGKTGLYRET